MTRKNLASLLLAITAGLPVVSNASTVLTFDGGTTNAVIPDTFGDRIPNAGGVTGSNVTNGLGTPNIELSWAPQTGTNTSRWEFYTDSVWAGVAQLNNASAGTAFTLTFTPDAGYGVKIESLQFFAYDNTALSQFNFDWAVVRVSDSQVMTSGTTGIFTGPLSGSPTITPNFTAADSAAYALVLTRNTANPGTGNQAYIAVDNITFSQVTTAVPEPSTYGLTGAAALAGVALLRRRRTA